MFKGILLGVLVFLFSAMATAETLSKSQICASLNNLSVFKTLANSSDNLMSFPNDGGLLNGGTCWWHSRLQQASLYLARFQPELPKPGAAEVRRLLSLLTTMQSVTVIPGYKNWKEFSKAWQSVIQAKLEDWQIQEGVYGFSWIDGLSGATQLSPNKLQGLIEEIKNDVEILGRISYAKLQLPGIASHALLVVDVTPIKNGYKLGVIDSNYPSGLRDSYYTFDMHTFYGGVPYLERRGDFKLIGKALKTFCTGGSSRFSSLSESELDRLLFESLIDN